MRTLTPGRGSKSVPRGKRGSTAGGERGGPSRQTPKTLQLAPLGHCTKKVWGQGDSRREPQPRLKHRHAKGRSWPQRRHPPWEPTPGRLAGLADCGAPDGVSGASASSPALLLPSPQLKTIVQCGVLIQTRPCPPGSLPPSVAAQSRGILGESCWHQG